MSRGTRIRVTVAGDEVVVRDLDGLADRGRDMSPALAQVADQVRANLRLQFATAGGGSWAQLAKDTARDKARRGLDPRILQATHVLRDSYVEKGAPYHVEVITGDSLRVESKDPTAGFHQFGTKNMPARPVSLSQRARGQATKTMQRYLVEGGARGGRSGGRLGRAVGALRGLFGR